MSHNNKQAFWQFFFFNFLCTLSSIFVYIVSPRNASPASGTPSEPGGIALNAQDSILIFILDGQRYALALLVVERVFPMVEITPLQKAPDSVQGIINMHGSIIPVFNIRRRFGIPVREYETSDQLIIAQTSKRRVALPVDRVQGVIKLTDTPVETGDIIPSLPCSVGVVKLPDGLILIHDPDTFLSFDEEAVLDMALSTGGT